MSTPVPEEFQRRPDDYEPLPEMWVDVDYYLNGTLVHPSRRETVQREAYAPGWTVQGARRGETP